MLPSGSNRQQTASNKPQFDPVKMKGGATSPAPGKMSPLVTKSEGCGPSARLNQLAAIKPDPDESIAAQ